jgi:hypothetical protein
LKPLRDKFEELAELLITQWDNLAQGTGVPFVRLLYHPDEELEAREHTTVLKAKLKKAGFSPFEIRCGEYPFKYYQQKKLIDLRLSTAEDRPAEAVDEMGKHAQEELLGEIIRQAEIATDKTVILLTETGMLYPFAHLSGVLSGCENKVHVPLIILYPVTIEEDNILFMGKREPGYYRTRDIN